MVTNILFIIILVLIALVLIVEVLHGKERRDLYDRIMSNSLTEYKNITDKKVIEPRKTAHQKAIEEWRDSKAWEK